MEFLLNYLNEYTYYLLSLNDFEKLFLKYLI